VPDLLPAALAGQARERLTPRPGLREWGRVTQVLGTLIEARLPAVQVGELCALGADDAALALEATRRGGATAAQSRQVMLAEVVGFTAQATLLASLSPLEGVSSRTRVVPLRRSLDIEVGPHLLGCVLDGFGRLQFRSKDAPPLGEDSGWRVRVPVVRDAPAAHERPRIDEPLPTGIRALDSLLTMGVGQRVGVFAGPGCGKTTLMAAIARGCQADVIVFGLIGERGRELNEFLEHELDPALVRKTIIVVATSDRTSMERSRAAFSATAVAEAFRAKGLRVLLLIDSLTRFARAQREIGLAAGEPPARGGFTPSVYTMLPRLIERAGRTGEGAISAMYTVLVDGDNSSDPIGDEARSLLDGHFVLSKKLAEQGHYPAIDVLASISRTMGNVTDSTHRRAAGGLRRLLSRYQELEMLIRLGEFKPGADPLSDRAVAERARHMAFLQQDTRVSAPMDSTLEQLALLGAGA
jgi:type III secretion protein N (ATPase)